MRFYIVINFCCFFLHGVEVKICVFVLFIICCVLVLQSRKAEEQKCLRLSAEFNQLRHDCEKRISIKDEEIEVIR
jgi:hypothetical protein